MRTILQGARRGNPQLLKKIFGLAAALGLLAFGASQGVAASVTTLAGGPVFKQDVFSGYYDGPGVNAQFNGPYGCALDSAGNLYIADRYNHAIRMMAYPDSLLDRKTTTLVHFTATPLAVAVDSADALYITTLEKTLLKYDLTYKAYTTVTNFQAVPIGVTVARDGSGTVFVALDNGKICSVTPGGVTVLYTFAKPLGITWTPGGKLAVTDGSRHSIWLVDPITRTAQWLAGSTNSTTGAFADGPAKTARFNMPAGLAAAGNGTLVVADRLNNRVRLVATDGTVSTLYGIDAASWGNVSYPGYLDTKDGVAQSRLPYSVTISLDGNIFVTELYYDLVRMVAGSGLSTQPVNPTAPAFSPSSGYFLGAQTITVTNAVGDVHYTTNGTEPTLSSPTVGMTWGAGTIIWNDPNRDLSSLRMKSFSGTNYSATVAGQILAATTPTISPAVGYYPQGQSIFVSNSVGIVLYTTNNTEPALGISPVVPLTDGVGFIQWNTPLHDLSWLRVKACNGTNVFSPTVSGQSPAVSVPTITPSYGYFPTPHAVTVSNVLGDVYYTLDGFSQPTMDCPKVPLVNGVGAINVTGNLSLLRVRAFSSPDSFSVTVAGQQIGVTTPALQLLPPSTVVVSNAIGDVFYTTDGSAPTIASACLAMTNGVGVVTFNTGLDLSLVRFKAYIGPDNFSPTVSLPSTTPSATPFWGYYPSGQIITVSNSVGQVFYTIDGTEPTTNSFPVAMTNGVGSFHWTDSLNDLSALRVKAFSGSFASQTFSGQAPPINEIGITRDVTAGINTHAFVPIVINMIPGQSINAIQFNVEVAPLPGNTNPIASSFNMISVGTNDFVPLIGPAPGNAPVRLYIESYYTDSTKTRGLTFLARSIDSGLLLNQCAVIGVLDIAIPSNVSQGQGYRIDVRQPSASFGSKVSLEAMSSRSILVTNLQYIAGDVLPKGWYGAGEFGDRMLDSSDIDAVTYASFGVRCPYPNSEAFNAMDVEPEDADLIGDGDIDYLDWYTIWHRAAGLYTDNWIRFRDEWGRLTHQPIDLSGASPSGIQSVAIRSAASARVSATPVSNPAWIAQVSLSVGATNNLKPGQVCSLPIYAKVLPGMSLDGFQFRAALTSDAAPLPGLIEFARAPGIPAPGSSLQCNGPTDMAYIWPTNSYTPLLQASGNLLGSIKFTIPAGAQIGQSYTLRLSYASGLTLGTPLKSLNFETFAGTASLGSIAVVQPSIISPEWLVHYFGSVDAPEAADNADPDNDGVPNWQEYLAGTDPTRADSRLELACSASDAATSPRLLTLTWLTALGRNYVVESSPDLGAATWTPVANVLGDGNPYQLIQTNLSGGSLFYRIRLQQTSTNSSL